MNRGPAINDRRRGEAPSAQARAVALLRMLEENFAGLTVAALARATAVSVTTTAKDLGGIREAGEPLEATGRLSDPHTIVRLGARADGAGSRA